MKTRLVIAAGALALLASCGPARTLGNYVPQDNPAPATTTTLPACPEVAYDGDLGGPGPQWSEAPAGDCDGPGQVRVP